MTFDPAHNRWPESRRAIVELVATAPEPPPFERVAPPEGPGLSRPTNARIHWRPAVLALAGTAMVVAGLAAIGRSDVPSQPTVLPADTERALDEPVGGSTPPADSPTADTGTTTSGMSARECTMTDPAMRPISPARALDCPDGTHVWVEGVVVEVSDGISVLCDPSDAGDPEACSAAGLLVPHLQPGVSGAFSGVVSNRTLGPASADGFVPPSVGGYDPATGELDPEMKAAAVLAMRSDPSVIAAVGDDFAVVSVEGMFEGVGDARRLIDASFLIRTNSPVALRAGTMTTQGHGEGEPEAFGPALPAWPLHSDFYVVPLPEPADGFFFLIKP